ncbi:hypothetical protein [Moraxella pluranimalium]|uniref:hypothetical protein n=1 Tax=Moraxella pluranimalium TaxID=470453 RepID=UPI001180B5E3|nr:hypothetical protein [Moraxella pluranimalium]
MPITTLTRPAMPTDIAKCVIVMLLAVIMTGCQHIQLVRSPLPVTLADVSHDDKTSIVYQQSMPSTIPVKNRPPKLTPRQQVQQVYLLENWF